MRNKTIPMGKFPHRNTRIILWKNTYDFKR